MKIWLLKRNHKLYNQLWLVKRLNKRLIEDDECAFQRNIKAVEYIDKLKDNSKEIKKIRKILTKFETVGSDGE